MMTPSASRAHCLVGPAARCRPRGGQCRRTRIPGPLGRHRRAHSDVRLARGTRRRYRARQPPASLPAQGVAAPILGCAGGGDERPRRRAVAGLRADRTGPDGTHHRGAMHAVARSVRPPDRPGDGLVLRPPSWLPRRAVQRHGWEARRRQRPGTGGHRHRWPLELPGNDEAVTLSGLLAQFAAYLTGGQTTSPRPTTGQHRSCRPGSDPSLREPEEQMMRTSIPSQPHVIVVGGGIGGLSAAFALARQGLRVRVLERARSSARSERESRSPRTAPGSCTSTGCWTRRRSWVSCRRTWSCGTRSTLAS